jgi:hypothetical protein
MKLSLNNFLYGLKQIVTGGSPLNATSIHAADGGFLHDKQLDFIDEINGAITQAGTSFDYFIIPRDYDEAVDTLRLHLLGSTAYTGDLTIVAYLTDVMVPGNSTAISTAAQSTTFTLPTVAGTFYTFDIDLSGNGMKRDTAFSISTVAVSTITQPTSSTDVIHGHITYASDLVAYDMFGTEPVNQLPQEVRG